MNPATELFMKSIALIVVAVLVSIAAIGATPPSQSLETGSTPSTRLGNFSVSLAVKDLAASREFYEKLGFEATGGVAEQNWLIMQNDSAIIGLFQGMFEDNIMTFNPGWNSKGETLKEFDDVRALQAKFEERGLKLTTRAAEDSTGPASFTLADPDGNAILFDQHVSRPAKK
ncbi:MAG: catechol 2,3-dioxygenase-like lactoylglutathione lyase family enzyme [Planctomycetota bacterium]|jgi:catechol 2,3-dioxygenase-like lactoylglutathione lyase family enzyme